MSASYVGMRDGRAVRLKRCDECGEEKVLTRGRDSAFYFAVQVRNDRSKVAWSRFCKACTRRRRRAAYAADPEKARRLAREGWRRLLDDPERHAAANARVRQWQRRRLAEDPDYAERGRAAHHRWMERKRAEDPDYFSRENRQKRHDARLAREGLDRRGGYGGRVPAEPFRRWVRAYMVATQTFSVEAVARDLGVVPRRLLDVVRERQENVALDTVDRALLASARALYVGGRLVWTIDDLYPVEEAA